jgi:hypothetical protein
VDSWEVGQKEAVEAAELLRSTEVMVRLAGGPPGPPEEQVSVSCVFVVLWGGREGKRGGKQRRSGGGREGEVGLRGSGGG